MTILQQHMQHNFNKLSPVLRDAHTGFKRLSGEAEVSQGNAAAKLLCRLFRFPPAGDCYLEVDCNNRAYEMLWHRRFNKHTMNSRFVADGEYLIEYLNGMKLYFKAVERNTALYYEFHHTRFLGIPVPNFLAPKILAFEQEKNGLYDFQVEVKMFPFGKVIAYRGTLSLSTIE
jgi:hypothetical protein